MSSLPSPSMIIHFIDNHYSLLWQCFWKYLLTALHRYLTRRLPWCKKCLRPNQVAQSPWRKVPARTVGHNIVSKRQIQIFLKAQRLIQSIATCTTDCGWIFLTGGHGILLCRVAGKGGLPDKNVLFQRILSLPPLARSLGSGGSRKIR